MMPPNINAEIAEAITASIKLNARWHLRVFDLMRMSFCTVENDYNRRRCFISSLSAIGSIDLES